MKFIDNFLNSITMYKLLSVSLSVMAGIAIIFSFFGLLPCTPLSLISSLVILSLVCFVVNYLIAKALNAPTGSESYIITALILFFLNAPILKTEDIFPTILVGIIAMASKYIFAIHKKHIFNPAAIASVIMGLLGFGNIIWWVGNTPLSPFSLILSLLIVKKIRRFGMFFTFLLTAIFTITIVSVVFNHTTIWQIIPEMFVSWPLIFFGGVMLTEPLTTPWTQKLRIAYGVLVGILFGSQFQFGPLYSTPELALVIGNVFTYIVNPKYRLALTLQKKNKLASNMYEFCFAPDRKIAFRPGQYFEWTLAHHRPDIRGNRRYFTIASSPTEETINLGVKIEEKRSSFKNRLIDLKPHDQIIASQLAGDFTFPEDTNRKLAFIAGGIGITPYRSMVQYLIDKKLNTNVVLLYSAPKQEELAYKTFFDEASSKAKFKVVYALTQEESAPKDWTGIKGRLNEENIKQSVPDYQERVFYLSGPNVMVEAYKKLLKSMGVKNIKTDYFPGF